MPFVDEWGDRITTPSGAINPSYTQITPTNYTADRAPLPPSSPYYVADWAAPFQSGGGGAKAWSPSSGIAPTDDQFRSWILNSPEYKQGMETAEDSFNLESGYAGKVSKIQNDQYGAQEADAARTKAMNDKRLREVMASRGILDSGQTQFELNNADYDYKAFLRDLMFQKTMREASDVYGGEKRTQQLQSARYQTYLTVTQYYRNLWWDPTTGRYVGRTGG